MEERADRITRQERYEGFQHPNRIWLPMFYLLPKELFHNHAQFMCLSRSPFSVLYEGKQSDLIDSQAFAQFIKNTYAQVIWRFIRIPGRRDRLTGIPGSMSDYSSNCPILQLTYEACEQLRLLLEETTYSLTSLCEMPPARQIAWPSLKGFYGMVSEMTARIIQEQNWQPIIDFTWENLTLEDFSEGLSRKKIDTFRRWHHTRTKVGKSMVSYDALLETASEKGYSFDIPDFEADPARIYEKREDAREISEDEQYHGWAVDGPFEKWLKGLEESGARKTSIFYDLLVEHGDSLSLEDRQLLALRSEGFTLAEIAEAAGFRSHSGVISRLKQIVCHCKEGTPLKPRRTASRTDNGHGFSLCRNCLRKEKPGKRDNRCRAYKQGSICAASDLTRIYKLHRKPLKKRWRRCIQGKTSAQ